MSGLPEGWAVAPIGELIELNPKNACDDDTEVGFVPMPLMSTSYRDEFRCEPRPWGSVKKGYTHFADGDVLLAKITPCFENGKAGLARGLPNGLGAGSTEYFVCRAKQAMLHPAYLFAYFKTHDFVRNGAVEMTGSVGHKRVPKDYVTGTSIPVAPLPEQKRIADKLDSVLARVDACRDRLDRIPALLKRFRQSVLAAATSGRLTEDWSGARPADEWRAVSLGEVATGFSYGSAAKSAPDGLVPVLRMGNIQDGRVDWSDLVFTSNSEEIGKYRLVAGDVLFNRTNSPELVGKTAVFKGEREAIYAGYLIRIRCTERLLPDYLNYCLGSPAGRDYCWRVKSDGVSQSNINAKKLAAFEFLLPTLAEQHEIVRRVETLFAFADRVEARCAAARKQAGQLTPALLAKAFRGELVPQDPADEPAAELLKRLAARRAEAPKARRGRKPVAAGE